MSRDASFPEGFMANVIPEPMSGCWLWIGAQGRDGYGRISFRGKTVTASRHFYERLVGPIPAGVFVCHRCDNPPCCNPTHLFLGTHADNVRDSWTKGRGRNPLTDANKAKTACVHGHPLTAENILTRDHGKERRCRVCEKTRWTLRNRKRSEARRRARGI